MGAYTQSIPFKKNLGTILTSHVVCRGDVFTPIIGIDNLLSFSKKIGAI